jgi:tetratricopeptide (TPR) repeat protein
MKKTFALLAALSVLGGCQTFSATPPADERQAPDSQPATPEPVAARASGSFSEETLYALLVAELAGQRNRFDLALNNYAEQARATRDPAVAERAFRIAEYMGAQEEARENALIWAQSAPDSLDAQRAAAIQLARAGRYDESLEYMEQVLQRQGSTHFDFLALSAADTDPETRSAMLQSFERLLARHPDNGQLLFAKALLLQQDDRADEALALLASHPASRRDVAPLLLRVRLLQNLQRSDEALPLVERGIQQHPDDKRLLLARARLLVELQRMDEAKGAFSGLLQRYPDDDDLRFSLALVCLEAESWPEAVYYLQELIERRAHVDASRYNLGRAYEELKEPERALEQYTQVGAGSEFLPAQVRQSQLLFQLDRADEARQRLRLAREAQPDYAMQLYLIEAEALVEQGQRDSAWSVLQEALEQFPNEVNLLYSRAMLAEQRGDLALMERDLRYIIEQQPDNAAALNALGYTLADRTTRYQEALELIEMAYSLDPDDPAIADSLGWVHYRLGNLEQAERLLREAHARFADHEVAAHLGEVLWHNGKQEEARRIWKQGLEQTPDSSVLRSTLLRLTGSETP